VCVCSSQKCICTLLTDAAAGLLFISAQHFLLFSITNLASASAAAVAVLQMCTPNLCSKLSSSAPYRDSKHTLPFAAVGTCDCRCGSFWGVTTLTVDVCTTLTTLIVDLTLITLTTANVDLTCFADVDLNYFTDVDLTCVIQMWTSPVLQMWTSLVLQMWTSHPPHSLQTCAPHSPHSLWMCAPHSPHALWTSHSSHLPLQMWTSHSSHSPLQMWTSHSSHSPLQIVDLTLITLTSADVDLTAVLHQLCPLGCRCGPHLFLQMWTSLLPTCFTNVDLTCFTDVDLTAAHFVADVDLTAVLHQLCPLVLQMWTSLVLQMWISLVLQMWTSLMLQMWTSLLCCISYARV